MNGYMNPEADPFGIRSFCEPLNTSIIYCPYIKYRPYFIYRPYIKYRPYKYTISPVKEMSIVFNSNFVLFFNHNSCCCSVVIDILFIKQIAISGKYCVEKREKK